MKLIRIYNMSLGGHNDIEWDLYDGEIEEVFWLADSTSLDDIDLYTEEFEGI